MSTSLLHTVYKALFCNSRYVFRMQKCYSKARAVALEFAQESPLIGISVGWFDFKGLNKSGELLDYMSNYQPLNKDWLHIIS